MAMHNEPAPINWRMIGMTARFVGIVAIALGFVIGIYGLEDTGARWLQTALGLLATGMLAQGYALYSSMKRMQDLKGQPKL
jgi:predicted Abi (CAAX) family protease